MPTDLTPCPAEYLRMHGQIALKVTPRARQEGIEGWAEDAHGHAVLKVKVRAMPEDGKANIAVIALLSRELGIPKSQLEITRGGSARQKILAYRGEKTPSNNAL